jgi:hypothetical protein
MFAKIPDDAEFGQGPEVWSPFVLPEIIKMSVKCLKLLVVPPNWINSISSTH